MLYSMVATIPRNNESAKSAINLLGAFDGISLSWREGTCDDYLTARIESSLDKPAVETEIRRHLPDATSVLVARTMTF